MKSHRIILLVVLVVFSSVSFAQVRNVARSTVTNINLYESEVVLDPRETWFDSGISVRPGDLVKITASGSVVWDPSGRHGTTGPEGANFTANSVSNPSDFPVPSAPCGSLVVSVGNSLYAVGSEMLLRPEEAGTLRLMVNDRLKWLKDNSGSFTVRVRKLRPISTVLFRGIRVELIDAYSRAGTVTLEMLATSFEDRRAISIGSSSSDRSTIWDDQGNSFAGWRGTFANQRFDGRPYYLIRGVPTRMTVSFDNVSPNVRHISSTSIRFWVTWPVSQQSENGEWANQNFGKFPLNVQY